MRGIRSGSKARLGAWILVAAGGLCRGLPAAAQINECVADNAPAASFNASCSGSSCTFVSTSTDVQGLVSQAWSFGDGASAMAASVSHVYAVGGLFLVNLTVTDTIGQTATETKVIAIGTAAGPLASDDELYADRDVSLSVAVSELLANDASGVTFRSLGGCAAVNCSIATAHGNLTYAPTAGGEPAYSYRSHQNFEGYDSFTYSVWDALQSATGAATVNISVLRAPPVAQSDALTTDINKPVDVTNLALLANDSSGAVFVRAENPSLGTLALVPDPAGGMQTRFTPASGFVGIASFEYLISWDGAPPYERGLVYVDVTDGPPDADFLFTCQNRRCTVDDRSGDDIGIVDYFLEWGDGQSAHYTEEQMSFPVFHDYAQSGRYVARLTVTDTKGQNDSTEREVTANTKPVAVNDTATTDRDVPVTVAVLANDVDADGDALVTYTATASHPGALIQVVPAGASWALRITPPDSFVGTFTVTYIPSDPWGGVAAVPGTVTVNVVQWTSVTDALGEQFYCARNAWIPISRPMLLGNDFDSDGDTLTIVSYDTSILMGWLDCTSNPSYCIYTPPFGGSGVAVFRYTVTDPIGHRDTATVRVYVGVLGTAPTLVDDYFTTVRNTPKSFTIQEVVANDVEPDGDTLTVTIASGAKDFGSIACSSPMYACTYTPVAGFVGADRFPYTGSDVVNPQLSARINVLTLPPATPTFDAREDMIQVGKNVQRFFWKSWLTTNDYDPERDPLTVTSIDTTGLAGTLTCDATSCTYKPGLSYTGTTRFKYTATDGHANSDTAIVKIRVGGTTAPGTNTPPVVAADNLTTPKNTVLRFSVFDLLRNDYDPDNDPLNVAISTWLAAKGTLSCGTPNYWCTYTPNANATGVDTIPTSVSDAEVVSSTLKITILP